MVNGRNMNMEHWWNDNTGTNLNTCRKTQVPFSPPQISYGLPMEQIEVSSMTGCD